jgi:hypothetical protein
MTDGRLAYRRTNHHGIDPRLAKMDDEVADIYTQVRSVLLVRYGHLVTSTTGRTRARQALLGQLGSPHRCDRCIDSVAAK